MEHSELKEIFERYVDDETGFIYATPEQIAYGLEDLESWEKQDLAVQLYGCMSFYDREFDEDGKGWRFSE